MRSASTSGQIRQWLTGAAFRSTKELPAPSWQQRVDVSAFGTALPILRPLLHRPGPPGRITLGLVWGLVPCALVYSVFPLAFFAGGHWQGAAVMLAFGLGTLPNLAATGLLRSRQALIRTHYVAPRSCGAASGICGCRDLPRAVYPQRAGARTVLLGAWNSKGRIRRPSCKRAIVWKFNSRPLATCATQSLTKGPDELFCCDMPMTKEQHHDQPIRDPLPMGRDTKSRFGDRVRGDSARLGGLLNYHERAAA